MTSEVERYMERALTAKKAGSFSMAVHNWKQAILLEEEPTSSMYISLAKSQYLTQERKESFENYLYGLLLQIVNFSQLSQSSHRAFGGLPNDMLGLFALPKQMTSGIDKDMLLDSDYQFSLLENFFNTTRHLAHSAIDLDNDARQRFADEVTAFLFLKVQKLQCPSNTDLLKMIDFVARQYAYDLAGGGIKTPPMKLALMDTYQIDFDHLYKVKGIQFAQQAINWKQLQQSL